MRSLLRTRDPVLAYVQQAPDVDAFACRLSVCVCGAVLMVTYKQIRSRHICAFSRARMVYNNGLTVMRFVRSVVHARAAQCARLCDELPHVAAAAAATVTACARVLVPVRCEQCATRANIFDARTVQYELCIVCVCVWCGVCVFLCMCVCDAHVHAMHAAVLTTITYHARAARRLCWRWCCARPRKFIFA